ncbi:hypothetical protein, partial [uncultured Eudoraea sp.]|uniref:hypothetical protein n=1 Tax=uncultured Eudoraea sp. TaxID=1035614 RepID=UPI00262FAA63
NKINPSATDGQVLTTVAGNAQWAAPTAGAVQTTAAIDGDGLAGNPLDLADNAVTTAKIADGQVQTADIADANVTENKINPSATDGQVLTTVAGNAQWATVPSPVKGIAKINSIGTIAQATSGLINSVVSNITGEYTVNLNAGFVTTTNFILQLSVLGDYRIYATGQGTNSFTIQIKTGQTNALVNADWYFTISE